MFATLWKFLPIHGYISLLGSMFPMPRVIYSMAKDGLLFQFLAHVHPKFQTPIWATLIGGGLAAILGGLFNLSSLIDMMSIGTLTAYTLVAICVLILRYRKSDTGEDDTSIDDSIEPITASAWSAQIFNSKSFKVPTKISSTYTLWTIVLYCILCFAFCGMAILGEDNLSKSEWQLIVPMSVVGVTMLFLLFSLSSQPTSRISLSFKVPLLPWIPGLSVLVNTYLILKLSYATWIRFVVWLAIGLVIYIYCLVTGRADKVYSESEEEYKNQKRNISKVSIHGIDNPALDYEDEEKYPSLNNQEKDTSKSDHFINEGKLTTKDLFANGSPANEKNEPVIEKVRHVLSSASPFDSTQAIHEINQKVLKGVQVPQNSLILSSEEDKLLTKAALQNQYPKETQNQLKPAEEESQTKPDAIPMSEEAVASILAAHETAQKCLNGEKTTSKKSVKIVLDDDDETENAREIVQAIIHKAENEATEENKKDAELFVDQILALAAEKTSHSTSSTPPPSPENEFPSDSNPYFLPPFVLRMNEKNMHQEKLNQLVKGEEEEDLIQFTEGSDSDVLEHIHKSCQDVISGKRATVKPLILSAEQRQAFLKEMSQLLQNLMDGSKDIPIIISDSDVEPQNKKNEIPPEFLTAILAAHEQAQKQLKPNFSVEKIHDVCVQTLNGKRGEAKIPICTVSPEMRAEAQQFIQQHMSDPKNQIEDAGHLQQNPDPLPPDVLKAAALDTQRIHEIIVKSLAPPDPLEKIHQVCQQTLLKDGDKLPLVLSTRSQRQENKDILKKLTNASILSQSQVKDVNEENPNPNPISPPTPTPPSVEQIQQILAIHQAIQACLKNNNKPSTTPENPSGPTEENLLENLQEIHQVTQKCLQGVDSSSLEPVLSKEEERDEIQTLNKKLTQEAFDKENNSSSSQLVDPDPLPPHIARQSIESMNRLHQRIQESLNDAPTPKETAKPLSKSPRFQIGDQESEDERDDEDAGYARVDSFVLTPATPPVKRVNNENGDAANAKKSVSVGAGRKKISLSPPKFSEEPLYAQVQKPKKDESRVPKTSVSFSEHPQYMEHQKHASVSSSATENDEEEEDLEPVKRSLSNRRPTGPFLPQLNKLKLGSNGFGYGSIEDGDEEEEEDENEEEEGSDSQSQSASELTEASTLPDGPESGNDKPLEEEQAVVTRRKSSQTKTVGDLISIFEQGHTN